MCRITPGFDTLGKCRLAVRLGGQAERLTLRRSQFVEGHIKDSGEAGGDGQRRLALVLFQLGQVALRDAGHRGEMHLGLAPSFPCGPDLLA